MASNNIPKTNTNIANKLAMNNKPKSNNNLQNTNNINKLLRNLEKNVNNTAISNNTNTTNATNNTKPNTTTNNNTRRNANNTPVARNNNTTSTNTNTNIKSETNKVNNKTTNSTSSILPSVSDITSSESPLWKVIKVAIGLLVLFGLLYIGQYLYQRYYNYAVSSPFLLEGNKNAKHALVVSQDPQNPSYVPIKRSEEQDGIQFTYSFWFYLENMDYKNGEWKHVFHKGNSSSYPNRAPGVWIHPTKNTVRIYMNTQENILEYVDIDNIPLRKWVHMAIILNNHNLDIYVNGYLKERKALESIPKQNDDDFWINMFGGFEGFVSNIRYFSSAIDFETINGLISTGPSKSNCIDTKEVPPYLDDNWWYSV